MSSDDSRRTSPDVRFLDLGTGMHNTFACGACTKHRRIVGRRLARVAGLRQWVCADCAARLLPGKGSR